jgi:regulator of sigma E protease
LPQFEIQNSKSEITSENTMLASLLVNLGPTLAIVLGFGFIIFVHELGHFLVAKAVGIKCTQFAIGFGQSLLTFRKGMGWRVGTTEKEMEEKVLAEANRLAAADEATQVMVKEKTAADRHFTTEQLDEARQALGFGETEYRLNWMPLGGYVKMLGQEDMDPAAMSDDPRSFNRKPVWARACVISAGVIMNLIFGLMFFVIAFLAGVEFPPAIVGATSPTGVAALTYPVSHPDDERYKGLQPGDHILSIDGEKVTDMMQVAIKVALANPDTPLDMAIQRDGNDQPLHYMMTPKVSTQSQQLLSLGIDPPMSLEVLDPGKKGTLPELLAKAGVKPGMSVVAVNGKAITRFDQFQKGITDAKGSPVTVTFADKDGATQINVTAKAAPRLTYREDDAMPHLMGLVPATRILDVVKGSVAEQLGLLPGDIISNLGNVNFPTMAQIPQLVNPENKDNSKDIALTLSVLREGKPIAMGTVQPRDGKLGIAMDLAVEQGIISAVLPDSPLADRNLPPGSRIKSIDEHPIDSFTDMQIVLQNLCKDATAPVDIHIGYQMNVKSDPILVRKVTLDLDTVKLLANANWALPMDLISGSSLAFGQLKVRVQADNPMQAISLGITKTHQFMVQTYITLARLFQGSVKAKHLRGPVGILDEGRRIALQGWSYLMFFLGLISVNLVVINFLPIPIVDGGLMVFLIIEKIKGSPVSARVQTGAMVVGLVLIACVFLVTLYYDVSRIEFVKSLMSRLF